jgi:hypothetical protein
MIQELASLVFEPLNTRRNSYLTSSLHGLPYSSYSNRKKKKKQTFLSKQFSITTWPQGNSMSQMSSLCPRKSSKQNSHKEIQQKKDRDWRGRQERKAEGGTALGGTQAAIQGATGGQGAWNRTTANQVNERT